MRKRLFTFMLACFGIVTANSQRQIPTPQLQNGKPVPQLVTDAQHLVLSQADQNPSLRYPILKPVKSYQKETLQRVPKQLKRRTTQAKPLQQYVKRVDDTNNIEIWGTVLSRPSWGDYEETSEVPFGVFSFDTDPNNNTIACVKQNSAFFANGGAAFYNGRFHYINYENLWGYLFGTLSVYDMNNWNCLTQKAAINRDFITTASTYDPTSGYVYGCTYNQDMDGMELAAFDYESQSRKLICKIDSDVTALACNKAGELFEITGNGYLAKVDKTTGQLTDIGYTGVTPDPYLQSAAIDPTTGKMYWAAMVDGAQSRLYLVDTATGKATLIKEFADAPEFGSLYIPEVKTGSEPETISNLNVSFANGEVTGDVTFTLPTKSVAGNVLSGNLDYYILCGGDTLCTSTGTPGQTILKALTLKAGANIILVFCKNANGESERARKYMYAGYDQPVAISNVTLTYDGYEAKLTWEAPTTTTHNGYLDTNSLTYTVVRYPQCDTVATGLKNTTFTETLPSDTLQHYHYTVTAVNNVTESDPAESNSVLIGKPFELPYTDDFESGNLYNYSTIDPSKSGYDWEVTTDYDNEDVGNVLLYSNYYCYDTANNWIVLPPINLKADNVTMVTFKAHTGDWDNSQNEKLNVMVGRNEDTKLFKKVQSLTVSSYNFSTFTVPVIVSEDGTYRIALQCVSDASSYGIYIDDLSVTAGPGTTSPAAVTELTVTPADKGEIKATVSFKTPDKSIAGDALSSLSKVELLREDGTVAGSISNPNPAKTYSIVDDAALTNGINTYSVLAYNAEGKAGLEAKASAYVGIDVPLAPTNTSVAYKLDGTAQISWNDPGNVGINNGYVDTKALTYNVYSVDSDGYLGDTLKSNLASNTCTLDIDQEGEQGTVYYGITAKSAGGEGNAVTAGPVISGKSYDLPFVESFPDGDKTNFWYYTADEDIYLGLTKRMSADDDNGAFYAYSYGDNPESFTFYSGKINLNDATNPVLTFMYYARPGADASMKIGINENGQTTDTLSTVIDYSKLTGKEGWRVCYVPLDAKYANDKYIALQFIGTVNRPSSYKDWYDLATIILDRIAVRDAKANDIEASITAPSKLLAQANADIKVSVSNIGRNTADDYDVTLYVNDKEWKTLKGPKLEPGELDKVVFTYPYNVGDPEENEVYAVVNYTADEDMSNNTTNQATFAVQHTTMPTIKDLTATIDGKTTNLHWTAPEVSGSSTTENFESYEDGTIDNMGLWTLINCDDDGSMSIYPGDWKHSNEQKSWMVADVTNNGAAFLAHSGDKLIISFPSYPETSDWLISPLLNGEAQTISFWAMTLGNIEQLSYYTSSTDTCINSFTKIKDLPIANTEWQKYSFEVPQGTRYFAIVHSYSSLACMIDDISFIQGAPEIKYFKIYRDRANVGQSDNTGYADVADESGVHTYNVTTVYNYGESDFSNDATVTVTGIKNIEADNGVSSDYYDVQGRRITQPAHGVTIVRSSNGKVKKTVRK